MLINILLAEDNEVLGKMLSHLFMQEGIDIDFVTNGEEALEYAFIKTYDVIILDWMLPKISGIEVCQKLRDNKISSGIIMLTARGEVSDKVVGLSIGADDYVVKPADFDELLARVKAVARRGSATIVSSIAKYGDIELDTSIFSAKVNGRNIEFTNKEFKLLEIFIRNSENIIPRDYIFSKIWANEAGVLSNTLDVFVKMLRNKLEQAKSKTIIKTVRGIGYKIEVEDS